MKDYTEDSVMIMPQANVTGLAAIRAVFTELFSGLFKPGTYDFTLDKRHVEGNVAYIVWHASTPDTNVPIGTDTFIVRDGTIAVQTFAAKFNAK